MDQITLSLMRKTCFEFSEVFEFLSFALRIYFSKKGKMQLILFAKNVTFKRGKILTSKIPPRTSYRPRLPIKFKVTSAKITILIQ